VNWCVRVICIKLVAVKYQQQDNKRSCEWKLKMARTREFSRKRPKKDNGAYLSNKFHAVHNNNNIKSVDQEKNRRDLDLSDNNNDNDEMNRHVHHDINTTMIGRKFQYVTRSGERKNYTILSYDSTNATHRVRRVKIIEEEKGEEKKYGQYHDHKTKDISMEGLPNIRWLDVVVPEGHLKVTYLYSSRYIGVQYTMGDNGCPSWKAFAPKLKAGTGRKKYVGTYHTERDAALAHDCYAREIGCSKLNFQDEFIYKEEATTLQIPPSSSASSIASLSSCDTSVVPQPNKDNCDGSNKNKTQKQVSRNLQQELPTTTTTTTTKEDDTELLKMKKISKYRGVSCSGLGSKTWRTQIAMKSVMTSLGKYKGSGRPGTHVVGTFEDEIEAALAYDEVLKKHGTISDMKKLNFPNHNNITIVEVANDEKLHSSVTKQDIKSPSDYGGKQKEKKRRREEGTQISQKKLKKNNNKIEKKNNGKNNSIKKKDNNNNEDDSSSNNRKRSMNVAKKENNKIIKKKDNTNNDDDSSSAGANNNSSTKNKKIENNSSIKKNNNNNKEDDSSSVSANNDSKKKKENKKKNKSNNSINNKSTNNKDDDDSSSSANNDGNNENKKKKKNENNNNINANNDGNKKKENKKKIKNNNSIKNNVTNNKEDDSSSSGANNDGKNKKKKKNENNTSIKKKNNNNIEDNSSSNNENKILNVANNDDGNKSRNKKKKNSNNIKKKDSSCDNNINKIKNVVDDNGDSKTKYGINTNTNVVTENMNDDSSSSNYSNNNIDNKKMNDKAKLFGLAVGDRIAFDFGSGIYFGSIDECDTFKKVKSSWNWNVTFDDGERYKFDYKDMLEAVTLYEKIKMDEMNDPNREKKVKEIKDNFFTQKKIILSKIPEIVEKQFLQVGFALWQKIYLPVMYLGPYDVSPGPVRDEWLAAFEKCDKSKVPQLVYWFGNNSNGAFSVLELTSCLSFEEGKRRGILRQKRGATDKNRFDKALVQLKEVLKKPLHKRIPFVKLKEEHEHLCGPQADRLLVELE